MFEHRKGKPTSRTRLIASGSMTAAGLAASVLFVFPALATPSSGIVASLLAGGNLGPVDVRANDKVTGDGNNRSNHWDVLLKTKDQSDVGVSLVTVEPGGFTGWHTHPGPILVTVKSGTITWYDGDDCSATTYSAGDSFVEDANHVHNVKNLSGSIEAQFYPVIIRPDGSPISDFSPPGPANCQI